MANLKALENKEKNTKLEFVAGLIALVISLIFVFSNHIAQSYQIYYVIFIFAIHQIIQVIIFNRWNINAEYSSRKILIRIVIIIFILTVVFFDFATINSEFSYNFNLPRGKKANTFYSVAIYGGMYFLVYFARLKRNIKNL